MYDLLVGVVIDQQWLGVHANHCVLSPSLTHCVTWATEPVDKTLCFWSIQQGRLIKQGTFTPDNVVSPVFRFHCSVLLLVYIVLENYVWCLECT